jgi:hypothetical protein
MTADLPVGTVTPSDEGDGAQHLVTNWGPFQYIDMPTTVEATQLDGRCIAISEGDDMPGVWKVIPPDALPLTLSPTDAQALAADFLAAAELAAYLTANPVPRTPAPEGNK